MSKLLTPTDLQQSPPFQPQALPPLGGAAYVIEGRPGWRYASIEEACLVAADLMQRLRLQQSVKVREAGSELVVAMTARDQHGVVSVVRLTGGAA
jgi:hypothetical protein